MIQRIANYWKSTSLQKPCSWAIEGGYPRMACGEGMEIFSMVKTIPEDLHVKEQHQNRYVVEKLGRAPCVGKEAKGVRVAAGGMENEVYFWDLWYCTILDMPHSLDVTYITKNMCESFLDTLLNMSENTKDGPKARNNLVKMGIREELHGGRPDYSEETDHKGTKT
jgi:hypothetical protein